MSFQILNNKLDGTSDEILQAGYTTESVFKVDSVDLLTLRESMNGLYDVQPDLVGGRYHVLRSPALLRNRALMQRTPFLYSYAVKKANDALGHIWYETSSKKPAKEKDQTLIENVIENSGKAFRDAAVHKMIDLCAFLRPVSSADEIDTKSMTKLDKWDGIARFDVVNSAEIMPWVEKVALVVSEFDNITVYRQKGWIQEDIQPDGQIVYKAFTGLDAKVTEIPEPGPNGYLIPILSPLVFSKYYPVLPESTITFFSNVYDTENLRSKLLKHGFQGAQLLALKSGDPNDYDDILINPDKDSTTKRKSAWTQIIEHVQTNAGRAFQFLMPHLQGPDAEIIHKDLSGKVDQKSLLDSVRMNKSDVREYVGIPKSRLYSDSSGNGMNATMFEWEMRTYCNMDLPMLANEMLSPVNHWLPYFPEFSKIKDPLKLKANIYNPVPDKDRNEAYQIAITGGWMTADEVREKEMPGSDPLEKPQEETDNA